jgi:hypothetical protein
MLSPVMRWDAPDAKATYLPSALMAGELLSPFACDPSEETLARTRVPVCRSFTNTSV